MIQHKRWAIALAAVGLCQAGLAQAVAIPLSALAGASPATAGTGLNGAYYDANVYSLSAAESVFANNTPTGTFTAKVLTYGGGGSVNDYSTNVAGFLGANASDLVGNFSSTLDSALYHFTGYINITAAMDLTPGGAIDVNFQVGSDDGMRLKIGDTMVTEYNAPRGFSYSSGTASFQSAGLYAIDLVFWENGGGTGLNTIWQTATSGGYQAISTSALYASLPAAVPEPATLALVGLGLIGVMGGARGRRRG